MITTILLAAAACQQVPAVPAESSEPVPEQEPTPAIITPENATALKSVYSASINYGAVYATWSTDSSSIWIEDGFSAILYDSTTGEMIAQFNPGEYAAIYDVSPDGKTAVYSQDGLEIRLYDVLAQVDTLTITPDFPYSSVFFNTDGSLLGVASLMDIKIVTWDTASGAETGSLSGFGTAAPVYDARFGSDGKTLLWFSRGTVQPMDIDTQEMGVTLSHEDFVTTRQISPDGKVIGTTATAMIGDDIQPVLTLWDASSGEILRQNANPVYFSSIAFSPDSSLLAAGTETGVLLIAVPHGDEIFSIDSTEVINSITFSPDGTKLVTCGSEGTINIYTVNE